MTDPRDSEPRDLLKIGDFARLAETNLRTLRYYEELGLLAPAHRSAGGFRYYRRTDVNRVVMIRDLQELGLALERIRELMSSRDEGATDRSAMIRRVRTALREHQRLLDARLVLLQEQRQKLLAALSKTEDCAGCTHTPCAENNFCEPCVRTGRALPQMLSALY